MTNTLPAGEHVGPALDARPARILVLAPVGRDADLTAELLARANLAPEICANADELCDGIREGAALVLMTAEALTKSEMERVAAILDAEPPWSEMPFMILVSQGGIPQTMESFTALGTRAHITLVDRPIHLKTLISATEAALRSRMRQYDLRDLLHRERRYAERLTGLAQASLAIASSVSLDETMRMITNEACRIIEGKLAITAIRVEENGKPRTISSVSCDTSVTPRIDDGEELFDLLARDLPSTVRVDGDAIAAHPLSLLVDATTLRSAVISPLQERDGATIGMIALASDRDDSFSADDQAVLMQLAHMASAAIQNARLFREAQAANRAKDDFLATLAHELRTPMTGILGWIQMLKTGATAQADVDMAIEMIESSTRLQARLVEDLLDVSRIIAGKLRIDLTAVELAPLVTTVVETFRARALESDVTLEAVVDDGPLSVMGDETRLHQIIWNLLSNAIKFTPAGGRVTVTLGRENGNACIRVSDTGQGIAPEFLPHVFDRFRQANTSARRESGLGLGLAIVHYLVELHSGTVSVRSDGVGHGTTFSITLPLFAVRVQNGEPPELRERGNAPQLAGVRVLVVDDEAPTGQIVATVLREFGAEALAVTSVAEAVKALRGFSADVIVSDIAMPGEDGYALMRRLHEMRPTLGHEIPTMALTGYGRPDDRSRILASGFQWYMQKPVEAVELAHAIESLTAQRR
jgi:signal transduction histidine kinase/ActR/RegA family two-component response regulator